MKAGTFAMNYKKYVQEVNDYWVNYRSNTFVLLPKLDASTVHCKKQTHTRDDVLFGLPNWLELMRKVFHRGPFILDVLHPNIFGASKGGQYISKSALDFFLKPLVVYHALTDGIINILDGFSRPVSQLKILCKAFRVAQDNDNILDLGQIQRLHSVLDPNGTGYFFTSSWIVEIWKCCIANGSPVDTKKKSFDFLPSLTLLKRPINDLSMVSTLIKEYANVNILNLFLAQNSTHKAKLDNIDKPHVEFMLPIKYQNNPTDNSFNIIERKTYFYNKVIELFEGYATSLDTFLTKNYKQAMAKRISGKIWLQLLAVLQIDAFANYKEVDNIRALIWKKPLISRSEFLKKLEPICSFQA